MMLDPKIEQLRHRCKTDLWFLCNDVLDAFNGNKFSEIPHKSMCDFYVKKDPSFKTFREFSKAYVGSHERIMMVPRQARKSGIKIIDNLQWIICWPEIRVMTCTATKELATAFINQLGDYFVVRGNAKRNPETNRLEGGTWSTFQQLFPEHCITETEANQGEYITPMRYDAGSNFGVTVPTAGTLSMDSSTSGWRCDVLDFDDPVSDRNSESGTQLEKLGNRIAMINELLMSGGFRHTVATRYDPLDPYGKQAEASGIVELYGDFERDGLKYMCRPCWWLKDRPFIQPDYQTGCPKQEDLDFFYPDGPSYQELKRKFKNPKVFFSQQLNDPMNATGVEFTDELLRSCLIDHSALPKTGSIFASWDLANTVSKSADYSSGIVGLIDEQRRWWIISIISGKYNFSERVLNIVKTIAQHHPRRTCIEDVHGVQDSMREPLDRQAKLLKVPLDIDWVTGHTGIKDRKYIRMCGLHPWMMEKRFFVLNTCDNIDNYIQQFKRLRAVAAVNDIPDAMARLVEQYTRYAAEVKAPTSSEDQVRWREMEDRDFHNMIFRKGKYMPLEPVPVVKQDPQDSPSFAIDELFQ